MGCNKNQDCSISGEICCESVLGDMYCTPPKVTRTMCNYTNTVYNNGTTWLDGTLSCNCKSGKTFCRRSGECEVAFTENSQNCRACEAGMDQLCENNAKCCSNTNFCGGASACLSKKDLKICTPANNLEASDADFKEGQTVVSPYLGLASECQSCLCSESGTAVRTGGGSTCTGKCAPNTCYITDEITIERNKAMTDAVTNNTGKYTCSCLEREGILSLKCGLAGGESGGESGAESGAAASSRFHYAAFGIIIAMAIVAM